jgi:hypothetical protein
VNVMHQIPVDVCEKVHMQDMCLGDFFVPVPEAASRLGARLIPPPTSCSKLDKGCSL